MKILEIITTLIEGGIGFLIITYFTNTLSIDRSNWLLIAPWGAFGLLINKTFSNSKQKLLQFNKWSIIHSILNIVFFIIYYLLIEYYYTEENYSYYKILIISLSIWLILSYIVDYIFHLETI